MQQRLSEVSILLILGRKNITVGDAVFDVRLLHIVWVSLDLYCVNETMDQMHYSSNVGQQ